MAIVDFPILYFPDPTQGRPLWNGQIYIGQPDLDPTILANQKTVRFVQEDGTLVATTQPIVVGVGGVPVYNGSPVRLDVDGNFSIKVLDRLGAQAYYIENVYEGTPIVVEDLQQYIAAEFATVSALISSSALNYPETIDWADYLGRNVTVVNITEYNEAMAWYTIKTVAQAASDGDVIDGTGAPDYEGFNHALDGGTYVAILKKGELFFDNVAGTPYLKTTSDVINGMELSVQRFIPRNLLSSIKDRSISDSSDLSSYFNAALDTGSSIFVPYGKYPVMSPVQIKNNGQSLYGSDGTNTANIVANLQDPGENAIEIWTGRRDEGNNSLTVTNQYLKNFRISSPSGSDYNSIIWLEAGCFHGMIEQIRIENLNGATPTSGVVKFDSNGGQSYPVHMGMRDVTITGGLNDDLSPILRGIWIEGAIEGYFDNVFVYSVEEAWVLGTNTTANIRNVENCTFLGCQGEIGDRGYASDTASALRIYQARDVDFISCKFMAGADFASPSNQNAVKFSQDSTSSNRGVKFRDTALWGQGGANYLIKVTGDVTDTFDVEFTGCNLKDPVLGILDSDTSIDMQLKWGDQTYIGCSPKYAKFQNRRFTVDPDSMSDGEGYLYTIDENLSPVGAAPTLLSFGADLQGILMSGYRNSTAGTYRVKFQNETGGTVDLAESSLRVRRFHKDEVERRMTYRYNPASLADNVGTTADWDFPGITLGDFVSVGFVPEQTGSLDKLMIDAYVSSAGVVSTRLQNQTGSGSNLNEGDLQIIKCGDFDVYGEKTYDAPGIADQSQATTTVNVMGVALGDFVVCSLGVDLQGLTCQCYISSNDVATVVLFNGTGGAVDLASTTLKVAGYKRFHAI